MKKRLLFAALALLLVLGVWALWPQKPGLPDSSHWELLEQVPPTVDTVAEVLDTADWTRTLLITEGELRGGKPSGETLTIRWAGQWVVPGVVIRLAWEAVWSGTPDRENDRLEFAWTCADREARTIGVRGRSLWAAAEKDGLHYRLERGLIWPDGVYWPVPRQADVSRGWIELETGSKSMNLYHADLTMTYSAGEQRFSDRHLMNWDGAV